MEEWGHTFIPFLQKLQERYRLFVSFHSPWLILLSIIVKLAVGGVRLLFDDRFNRLMIFLSTSSDSMLPQNDVSHATKKNSFGEIM